MNLRDRIQAQKLQGKSNISRGFVENDLEKAKYFKREGTPGNYKYYYTEEEYKKAKSGKSGDSKKPLLTKTEGTLKSKDGEVVNYRVYSDGGVKIESQNMRKDFKTKEDAENWIKNEGVVGSKNSLQETKPKNSHSDEFKDYTDQELSQLIHNLSNSTKEVSKDDEKLNRAKIAFSSRVQAKKGTTSTDDKHKVSENSTQQTKVIAGEPHYWNEKLKQWKPESYKFEETKK